jgi:cytochrome c oxidase accessory protein FixG
MASGAPSNKDKERVHLPVVDRPSSLRGDGTHVSVIPADVHGRFTRARHVLFSVLLAFGVALPLIRIHGRPALFLDVPARHFYVFGQSFNAQDGPLTFFLLTGLGFALLVATTTLGRAWCGWTCPQTVLLEGLFRPIERLIEGPRNIRLKRDSGVGTWDRTWRKLVKHTLFLAMAFVLSHLILAYFVSMPSLGEMLGDGPWAHPVAFGWASVMGLLLYIDMAWFREQLCLIVCPYGRLQSTLTDDDSLVVGYDSKRGEPRGKKNSRPDVGDCVDCGRCVAVCPTGIDIRYGLQVDCIACTQCIDACDEIMDKLERPRGLIRYDSLRGLRHEPRRFWRPRLTFYSVLGVFGVIALSTAIYFHRPFAVTLVHARGAPFVVDGDTVRNTFDLHLVNKRDAPMTLQVRAIDVPEGVTVDIRPEVHLDAEGSDHIVFITRVPRPLAATARNFTIEVQGEGETTRIATTLLHPPH